MSSQFRQPTGIGAKIFLVMVALILISLLFLLAFTRLQIQKQFASDIKQYRVEEQEAAKQYLKNYISIAYRVLESEYRKAHDRELIIDRFGPRLEKVISVIDSILEHKISEVANGRLTAAEAQNQALEEIRAIRYDNAPDRSRARWNCPG